MDLISRYFGVFIKKVQKNFKLGCIELLYILGAVLFVVLVTLWGIAFTPIYLLRFCLRHLARKWRSDLLKILSIQSTITAVDDMYGKPTAGIVTYLEMDGKITEEILNHHLEKQLNIRNSQGKLCYPQFKQYITKWLGFYFFKQVENFDIRNYYTFYEGNKNEEFLEKDLGKFVSDWLAKPFPKYQSPWSYCVIHNFRSSYDTIASKSNKSLILFRHHHALMDGFSLTKFFNNISDSPTKLIEPSGILSKLGSWRMLSLMLFLLFLTPYRFVKMIFHTMDRNEWHESKYSNEVCYTVHPRIPVNRLKEVKEMYDVSSISVVILAGIAGTVRQAMVSQCVKVPDMVNAFIPFSVPGHPNEKLVNHAGLSIVNLPVGISDPVARLEAMNQIVGKLSKDLTWLTMFRFEWLYAGLLDWIVRPICRNYYTTVNASTMPGPKEILKMKGIPVTDVGYFVGTMMGNPGVMFNTMTYNGHLRVTVGVNKELKSKLPNLCLDDIAAGFGNEIDILETLGSASKKLKVL